MWENLVLERAAANSENTTLCFVSEINFQKVVWGTYEEVDLSAALGSRVARVIVGVAYLKSVEDKQTSYQIRTYREDQ
jgi:CRISPR/Cas system endoribonuclease Cas6 (RAMP superfamily)